MVIPNSSVSSRSPLAWALKQTALVVVGEFALLCCSLAILLGVTFAADSASELVLKTQSNTAVFTVRVLEFSSYFVIASMTIIHFAHSFIRWYHELRSFGSKLTVNK
jgi:hypothetical protein